MIDCAGRILTEHNQRNNLVFDEVSISLRVIRFSICFATSGEMLLVLLRRTSKVLPQGSSGVVKNRKNKLVFVVQMKPTNRWKGRVSTFSKDAKEIRDFNLERVSAYKDLS